VSILVLASRLLVMVIIFLRAVVNQWYFITNIECPLPEDSLADDNATIDPKKKNNNNNKHGISISGIGIEIPLFFN
jgi:hypothetical protein